MEKTDIESTDGRKPAPLVEQYNAGFVERWDDLIDWERRRESEAGFFIDLLRRNGARRVLDVAAGTGFHSISLVESGFDVVAVDASEQMLLQARKNALRRGHGLEVVHADWGSLGKSVSGKFDAIVCLGSSFPHLFSEHERREALSEFYAALNPGGLLIVDHRNFDSIRAHRYKSSGNYYYCGSSVSVNVDHIDETLCRFRYDFPEGKSYKLEVYPILSEEMRTLLKAAGFTGREVFGDFKREYDPDLVDFVIHTAHKGSGEQKKPTQLPHSTE